MSSPPNAPRSIGEAADPEAEATIRALMEAQSEIDSGEARQPRISRAAHGPGDGPGGRPGRSGARPRPPEADQIFLDVAERAVREAQGSPAATGERGGA
ncbi:hypothetical protein GCM10022233_72380 [Streptomyces shaanxiensis]|uniref:Uncharacterized protein n=1 Tax=Streptomyces shaanxiensis TaxID=653357 RepID=A0ABP7W588_9ACTN